MNGIDLVLRVLAAVVSLTSLVLLRTNTQDSSAVLLIPMSPPLIVPVYFRWHHASALVYLLAVTCISLGYSVVSIVLTLAGKKITELLVSIFDLIMVALLFSGVGAGGAFAVLAKNGNSHANWTKVCDVLGKACHKEIAGIVLTLIAALAFVILVTIALCKGQKKS